MSATIKHSKKTAPQRRILTAAGAAVGFALMAGVAPAEAADWNNGAGSIKDRGAAIPVPAPIPVMEHFSWYIRADVGLGIYSGGGGSERGLTFGAQDTTGVGALTPFGTSSSWFADEFNTFATGGIGAGMYLTPRWRGDVTIDTRTKSNLLGNGSYVYDQYAFTPAVAPTGVQVRGSHFDKTEVRDTSGLLNVYYDLTDRGGLTPYVGAGIGFVVRTIDRRTSTSESLYDMTNPAAPVFMSSRTNLGQGKAHVVAPAAALTVGAAYSLPSGMILDFNYRYTYLGGVESSSMINGSQSSLKIDDSHDHALRAGLRVNVW